MDANEAKVLKNFEMIDPPVDFLSKHLATMYEEQIRDVACGYDSLDSLNDNLVRIASAYQEYINAAVTMNSNASEAYPDVELKLVFQQSFIEKGLGMLSFSIVFVC